MNSNNLVVIVIVVIGVIVLSVTLKERYYKTGKTDVLFNNSDYEYSNPSVSRETQYYSCISSECGGETKDYDCLQKCHIKSFEYDSPKNIKNRVCEMYTKTSDEYYKCLAQLYSDYRYP